MKTNYKSDLYSNLNKHNFISNEHEFKINSLQKLKSVKKIKKINQFNKKKLFIIFENKKKISTIKKISFITSILENFRILNIKKKAVFILISKNENYLSKLEKKIFYEMINAYNNMFLLKIFFFEKVTLKSKIDLAKVANKYKLK